MLLKRNAVAYSATTVAASLMNFVFQFYYVNIFLNVYHITPYWFNQAQVVYLIWNAINDPLFGYIQDHSSIPFLKHRRLNILYGAPLFALSFLLPWFGWAGKDSPPWVTGLHLIVSLCFYDGMFTFVVLAQCSLFAEISTVQQEKETVLKYSQIGSIIGSLSILFCEIFTDHMKDLFALRVSCIVIAAISFMFLWYSGSNLKPAVDRGEEKSSLLEKHDLSGKDDGKASLLRITQQIFSERNFICFVMMNFLQVFHTTVSANFFGMFRDHLGEGVFSTNVKSIMAGSAFVLPQIIVLMNGRILASYGSYALISWSFYIKVIASVTMYIIGPTHIWILGAYMLIDAVLPSAAFSLFNLTVSDIIQEDQRLHNRRLPLSSMVFGLNALVTKPAQSIAPMTVLRILSNYGYQPNAGNIHGALPKGDDFKSAIFGIVCFFPAIIGVVQMTVWRFYTLRQRK